MAISIGLLILLLAGSFIYLGIILFLLRKGKLNVQYSIIWLASAFVFILCASVPGLVSKLRHLLNIETDANFMFIVLFAFILLILLSLSTIVTGFSSKIKRLSQTQALLEKRIRELEDTISQKKNEQNGNY